MNTIAAAGKSATSERFRRELSAKRVIIGFLVAGIGIASIFNDVSFAIVITAIAVIGATEFSNLARRAGAEVALPIAVAACAAYPLLAYVHLLARYESALIVIIVLASFAASMSAQLERFAGRAAMTVLATLYLGKLLTYFIILHQQPDGARLTLWLVVIVALTDIVGMMAGLGFGHHPLAPKLSPSKTQEGAVAALVVATFVGAAMWWIMRLHGPWWLAFAFPLSVSVAAEFGDLVESALKRNAHVKDSGQLIAGHGGVLDRFDSYIFAGVVGYTVLLAAGAL
ncbi:MAG: phosphatidate cytidylyltransferase [Candidatus Eremiobacteraeota bacterium]|nr:phosphatidate cytidylyltransferase [Candidatus Eremiobacteraeota bacterium]